MPDKYPIQYQKEPGAPIEMWGYRKAPLYLVEQDARELLSDLQEKHPKAKVWAANKQVM